MAADKKWLFLEIRLFIIQRQRQHCFYTRINTVIIACLHSFRPSVIQHSSTSHEHTSVCVCLLFAVCALPTTSWKEEEKKVHQLSIHISWMFFFLPFHLVFSGQCWAIERDRERVWGGDALLAVAALFTTHVAVVDVFAAEKYKPRKTRCARSSSTE